MAEVPIKLTTGFMRVVLYVAGILVLAVSISLYFFPGKTDTYFSWTIKPPLTAAFLGAGYLASFFLEFLSARERIWANTRTAVPAVWIFTLLTLIITLVHFDRFHFTAQRFITVFGTWFWLLVYVSVPIVLRPNIKTKFADKVRSQRLVAATTTGRNSEQHDSVA